MDSTRSIINIERLTSHIFLTSALRLIGCFTPLQRISLGAFYNAENEDRLPAALELCWGLPAASLFDEPWGKITWNVRLGPDCLEASLFRFATLHGKSAVWIVDVQDHDFVRPDHIGAFLERLRGHEPRWPLYVLVRIIKANLDYLAQVLLMLEDVERVNVSLDLVDPLQDPQTFLNVNTLLTRLSLSLEGSVLVNEFVRDELPCNTCPHHNVLVDSTLHFCGLDRDAPFDLRKIELENFQRYREMTLRYLQGNRSYTDIYGQSHDNPGFTCLQRSPQATLFLQHISRDRSANASAPRPERELRDTAAGLIMPLLPHNVLDQLRLTLSPLLQRLSKHI